MDIERSKSSIGICGLGFVGKAVAKGFCHFAEVKSYDVDKNKTSHDFVEVISSDFVFICVPTPMVSAEGGKADLSIIYGLFERISNAVDRNPDTVFLIKSTVPVGTTKDLIQKTGINQIVHCPEFLTARSALIDFITPSRTIIGGQSDIAIASAAKLMEDRFPGTRCFVMTSDESEMVKYMANCFFATKVTFFNEMKLLIDKLGLDWDQILDGVMSDGRIGLSHYQVPGYDGDRGFGGSCFPKDINALIVSMIENGIDPKVLKAVWEQNKAVRSDWDWAHNKSAVS